MSRKINKTKIELPYNPDDVNIRLQHFRVSELVNMINKKALDILNERDFELIDDNYKKIFPQKNQQLEIWNEDDLQRHYDLWDNAKKSLFIESLMIRLPIPLFYLDGGQRPWRVVDGLQRLHAISSFIDKGNPGHYKLKGLEYLIKDCEGRYFDDLPGHLRARILNAELEAYVINPGTPEEVKYNIFKRINTGGLKLTGQEIRNAFYRGIPAEFTKQLASEEIFKKVTGNKVSSRRMEDREYVTRFVAFQIYDYNNYSSKLDIFLTDTMMELGRKDTTELIQLRDSFITSCSRIYDIFGSHAFYRIKKDRVLGRRPNKALFDTLSWNFERITGTNFNLIKKKKEQFCEKYTMFMISDEKLYKAIADTTGTKTAVKDRFERMSYFIQNFIQ